MAYQCEVFLLGLVTLFSLFTGTSGAENIHVFSSSKKNLSLPCYNALSDCTSTTWTYKREAFTVKLVTSGIVRNDRERDERLSLGSDCSLNIKHVSKEDHGTYSCRHVKRNKQGTEAEIYLHVLHVSSSSSQTEIRPGRSVTLSCQLHHGVSCDHLTRFKDIQLMWVNQAGVNLMTDSRYQILFSSSHCVINLTTTLLNEDDNREWRCQLTQRNQLKTSLTYTVKYSAEDTAVTPVIPETFITHPEDPSTLHTSESPTRGPADTTAEPEVRKAVVSLIRVTVIVVEIAVFAAPTVFLLQIICLRRAGKRTETNNSLAIKDDVTYTEVATNSKNRARKNKVHGENKVTYSSIRGRKGEPRDYDSPLYAYVN